MEKTLDEVLEEIFKVSPIPNNLKQPKKLFKEGKLGVKSKIRIIEQHSDYRVKMICVIPEAQETTDLI